MSIFSSKSVDLLSALRAECLRHLPYDKNDSEVCAALAVMPTQDILVWFLNWIGRIILPYPRVVLISNEFFKNPVVDIYKLELKALIEKIRKGDDVTAHLSTRILQGFTIDKSSKLKTLSRRAELDLLLNDWGIYHLHLSAEIVGSGRNKGFTKRGGILLFGIFTDDCCYVIDVLPHKSWGERHLAEVVVRNWPDAGLFERWGGIPTDIVEISGSDRAGLRAHGITTILAIDGKIYFPPKGGITVAGISGRSTDRALDILASIEFLENDLKIGCQWLRSQFESHGKTHPANPDYCLKISKVGSRPYFGVFERVSQTMIEIG